MQNRHQKLMLIDDNEIDLKINSKLISLVNLFEEIITCQSGEEALDYLNKHLSSPERLPNFILLDIQMPEMDGFEFLERYGNFPDKRPVAMLSSTLDFSDVKRAEASPYVVKLLKKPLMIKELETLLLY
jgi:CheY-like chemotaxis protein